MKHCSGRNCGTMYLHSLRQRTSVADQRPKAVRANSTISLACPSSTAFIIQMLKPPSPDYDAGAQSGANHLSC